MQLNYGFACQIAKLLMPLLKIKKNASHNKKTLTKQQVHVWRLLKIFIFIYRSMSIAKWGFGAHCWIYIL